MSDVGDAIDEAREALADAATEVLTDLCDIIPQALVSDGHSGQTLGDGTPIEDVPIDINEVAPGERSITAGGQNYQATHVLTFAYSDESIAITPKHKIRVHPRGLVSELIFEKPVPARSSKGPWLKFNAVLTTGFREPANV